MLPLKQKDIAEILKISRSYLSELLGDMEREGLVTRDRIGGTKLIQITEKGIAFVQRNLYVAPDQLRKIIEHILDKSKIKHYKRVLSEGIEFDFAIPSKNSLIKIIDGIKSNWIIDFLEALCDILEKGGIEISHNIEIIRLIESLIEEKGLLLSVIHYASRHPTKKILLIIAGDDPKEWPGSMIRIINTLGNRLGRQLAVNAHKALRHILSKTPENMEIIFASRIVPKNLREKIIQFLCVS